MTLQHKGLTGEKWSELRFCEQMANVGSEVERALKWKEKGNEKYCEKAFFRALELIDLTIKYRKNNDSLKELMRLREAICDYFTNNSICYIDCDFLKKYFYYFAYSARKMT